MSVADVLSLQLYTMRSLGDLDRILAAAAEAGYHHVETVGSQLDDGFTSGHLDRETYWSIEDDS